MRPEAYSPVASEVSLRETHISWVFLLEREVFKVKKPVNFGFLDFTTLEQRKVACDAELRLNARLARDIYLNVVPVRTDPGGHARIGGDGEIVDWAVHMVRLPDETRTDLRLARGRLARVEIERIARTIAAFHAAAGAHSEGATFGSVTAVGHNVEENFAQTASALTSYLQPEEADELRRWQRAFLRDNAILFEARVAKGRVREGHGDLRLEHVYLREDGNVTIIDCIEFAERYRVADVCADIAFLSMDLACAGRVDLAERLLAVYAREADDFDLYAVVDFYESYRAFVRGKIASMLATDPTLDDPTRRRAEAEARRLFVLALSFDRRTLLTPSVVAVGGIIGSGKSSVAEHIGEAMGAPVIDADRTRKQMLGVATTRPMHEPAWSGAYDPTFTETVYAEVLRRAGVVLASGRPVVLDASFRSKAMRRAARELAMTHGVPFRLVECRAPADVCRARIVEREREHPVSDGRLAIFDDFVARFEPMDELANAEHLVVDTTLPIERNMESLRRVLDTWPKGFAG